MKLFIILLSAVLAPVILGAAVGRRQETNAARMKRGLPPRSPVLASRATTAGRKASDDPARPPLFPNGGLEDAFLSPKTRTYESAGWDGTDVRYDSSLAHTGDFYALISPTGRKSITRSLTDLDTTRPYTLKLWPGFVTADVGVTETAYKSLSATFTPKAPVANLWINAPKCEGWASGADTSILLDDINVH